MDTHITDHFASIIQFAQTTFTRVVTDIDMTPDRAILRIQAWYGRAIGYLLPNLLIKPRASIIDEVTYSVLTKPVSNDRLHEQEPLMYIADFIWLPDIIEKLAVKHRVTQDEVEEVFFNRPQYRFVETGHRVGEDVYAAGGQTDAGRYVIVVLYS